MSDTVIESVAEDVFEGHPIGIGGKAVCERCRCVVRSGDVVGVYVCSMGDSPQWEFSQLACADCRREEISAPQSGISEFLTHCRLAVASDPTTQTPHLVLRDVSVIEHNAP